MGTEPEAAGPGTRRLKARQCLLELPQPPPRSRCNAMLKPRVNCRRPRTRRPSDVVSHAKYLVDVAAGHFLAHILSHGQKSPTCLWARNLGQGQLVGRRAAARSAARTRAARPGAAGPFI